MKSNTSTGSHSKPRSLRSLGVGLLTACFVLAGLGLAFVPPVHATSQLIQQNNAGCSSCSGTTVSVAFGSSVAPGDVVVVGVEAFLTTVTGISDSQGLSYVNAVSGTDGNDQVTIFVAPIVTGGADSVTVTFAGSGGEIAQNVYIYEVSGVTNASPETGSGANTGTSSIATSPVTFQTGAFLLGMMGTENNGATATGMTVTPGTGFTLSTDNSGTGFSHAQYATSSVSSPTTFPATITSSFTSDFWAEVGIALNPGTPVITSTTTTTATVTSTVTSSTTVTSTTTSTTTVTAANLLPSSTFATCDRARLTTGQSVDCYALVYSGDEGVLTGSVVWSTGANGGTFSHPDCNSAPNFPNPFPFGAFEQGQIQCHVQYTPGTGATQAITATYSGDAYHGGSSDTFQAVLGTTPSSQTTVSELTCDTTYLQAGQRANCTLTITSASGTTPTGTANWSTSGSGTFSRQQCSVQGYDDPHDGNGQLQCSAQFTATATGAQTITATYSGDASHTASGDTFNVFVEPI
jgi:hypothetical protein